MVVTRPGTGGGDTEDDEDDTGTGGMADPGAVGADDPGSIDPAPDPSPDPSDDDDDDDGGYEPAPEPEDDDDESTSRGDIDDEDTADFDDVSDGSGDDGGGGYADPGDTGADDPGSIPDDQGDDTSDTDDGGDVGDGGMASPGDVGATDPPSIDDGGDIGADDPTRTDTTKPSAGGGDPGRPDRGDVADDDTGDWSDFGGDPGPDDTVSPPASSDTDFSGNTVDSTPDEPGTSFADIGLANRLDDLLAEEGIRDAEYARVGGDVVVQYERGGRTVHGVVDLGADGVSREAEAYVDRENREASEAAAELDRDLAAGAAAATSGAGEMARGVSATDFAAFGTQVDAVAEDVEQRYPTLDQGEDYTIGIDQSGDFTVSLTDSGEAEVRQAPDRRQAAIAAATSGPGELARRTPDIEPPESPEDLVQGFAGVTTGFRPRDGGTAERAEAATGRDVDGDGHVTTPEEYIRGAAEESFESQTGAELDEGDVAVTRDRGGNVSAYLTPSGEEAVESALAGAGLTFSGQAPTAAPPGPRTYGRTGDEGAPSITIAGPSSGVDVESGAYGTNVGTSERAVFGEFEGPIWGAYESTVESATGAVQDFTDRGVEAMGAADTLIDAVGSELGGPEERVIDAATPGTGEQRLSEGVVGGTGDLAVGGGELVTEGPELVHALATSEEAREAAPAAAGGMLAAAGTQAIRDPWYFAGQLVGSAALSGGAVSALQGTRFGGAARFAASPVGTTVRADTPDVRGATRGGAERVTGTARDMVDRIPEFRRDTSTGRYDAQNLYGQPPRAIERRSDAFDTSGTETEVETEDPVTIGGEGADVNIDVDPEVDPSPSTLPGNEGAGVDTGEAWSPGGAWPDHMLPEGHPLRTDTEGPSGQRALELAEERRAAEANERLAMAQRREVDAGVRRRFATLGGFAATGDVGYRGRQRLESAQALEVQQRSRGTAELSVGFDSGIGIVSEYETESAVETGVETGTGVESELSSETAVASEPALEVGFESASETAVETRSRRRRRRRPEEEERMGFSFGEPVSERDEDAGLGYIGETFAGIAGVDYEAAAGRTSVQQARETGLPDFSRGQQEAFSETLDVFGLGGR